MNKYNHALVVVRLAAAYMDSFNARSELKRHYLG